METPFFTDPTIFSLRSIEYALMLLYCPAQCHRIPLLELRHGEVHDGVKSRFAPPRLTRAAGKGMPISSGIMFLMYRIDRLVVLVYIRQPLRHRGGAVPRVLAPLAHYLS